MTSEHLARLKWFGFSRFTATEASLAHYTDTPYYKRLLGHGYARFNSTGPVHSLQPNREGSLDRYGKEFELSYDGKRLTFGMS